MRSSGLIVVFSALLLVQVAWMSNSVAADRDDASCHWVTQVPSGGVTPVAVATGVGPYVYVTGSFSTPTPFDPAFPESPETPLGLDMYLVKYSSNGDFEDVWTYGECTGDESEAQYPTALATGPGGSVYVAGQFNGAIHIGDCGGGADDCDLYAIGTQANIFIARVASSGDCIWGLSFGNSAEVAVTSLAVDDSGNVFVLGYFQGDIDFGSGEHSATSRDMFIAVFSSADGTLLWDAAFTSSGTDTPRSIALSSSTGFAITGTFDGNLNLGSGILLTPPVGSVDVFAASFSGDLQSGFSAEWGSAFGSTLVDPSYDIATSSAGGVLVACGFHGTLTVGGADYAIADPGGVDDALIMFDDQGAVEWVLALGGSGSDAIGGVAIDAAGSVLVTGYVTGLAEIGDIDFGLNDSVRRGLLAKLDGVDGSTVWVLDPFGASNTGNTTAADVSLDEWDYILVHGHYNSVPLSMGNCTVMTSAPGMFTAKLGGTVTGDSPLVDAVEPGLSVVAAWPNPFFRSTAISYALDRHRQVAIDIVDVQGRHVRTLYEGLAEAGINTVEWDGKSDEGDRAPAGVYFCQMDWGLGRDSKSLCLLR